MPALLLLTLLCAVPPASRATELARKKDWDRLLLTFAPVKPSALSSKEAAQVSEALTQGCHALERRDAVMAFDLGKHAAEMSPAPEALLCWARAARRTQQAASAEEA